MLNTKQNSNLIIQNLILKKTSFFFRTNALLTTIGLRDSNSIGHVRVKRQPHQF